MSRGLSIGLVTLSPVVVSKLKLKVFKARPVYCKWMWLVRSADQVITPIQTSFVSPINSKKRAHKEKERL